jgi:hypothetical protein
MTNAERFRLVRQMIKESRPALLAGSPEQVRRRFELLRRQNDERNRLMLDEIGRSKESRSKESP